MREDIETVLRAGSDQLAGALSSPAADLIRARGDRRRRHQAAASAALVIVAVVGALAGFQALAGPAGPGGPVTGSSKGLRLIAPRRYAPGVPNPVSFVIPSRGLAATVTVIVDLGRPSFVVYRAPVVLRRDPLTGRWATIAMVPHAGGWRGSYRLRVPAWSTMQRLLVVPPGPRSAPPFGAGRLRVSVLDGRALIGAQAGPPARLSDLDGTFVPASVGSVPPDGRKQLSYVLANHAGTGYRVGVSAIVYGRLCHSGGSCSHPPAQDAVQWLDAGTWRTLGPAAYQPGRGQFLRTAWLAPGGTVTIRLRVLAGAHATPTFGAVSMIARPDRSSFPGPSRWYSLSSSSAHTPMFTVG